jgi:mannose-6-phosphate isomerase-like protein (cupin superfamily)
MTNTGIKMSEKINFNEKYLKFSEYWEPKVISKMNNYQFKLVKIKGDFVWHSHEETDEAFIVIEGKMEIHLRTDIIKLNSGELYVVKKGVEHKPFAEKDCHIMIIEPENISNTGNKNNKMTSKNNIWI